MGYIIVTFLPGITLIGLAPNRFSTPTISSTQDAGGHLSMTKLTEQSTVLQTPHMVDPYRNHMRRLWWSFRPFY